MKRPLHTLLAVLLTISLAACRTPAVTTTPSIPNAPAPAAPVPAVTMTPPVSVTAAPAVVTFTDPVLEEMVRGAMGKPEGDITVAEAAKVTRLNLSNEWQRYISDKTVIRDIAGLEHFTNLENLDLSFHAIADVSALAGLAKLTLLSLGGNPVADISPLARLTNLTVLNLSNCAAQDYSPLAKLVNLNMLMLDNSTITDVAPLASLANLQHLHLANCTVSDYSPLANIYPNLSNTDFTMAFTLKELGFAMNEENNAAKYANESLDVIINHAKWGAPPMEWDANCVRLSLPLEDGYILKVTYHPDLDAYVFGMGNDGAMLMNYVYERSTGNFTFEAGDQERSEQVVRAAIDIAAGEDVLLAPIRIYNDTIQKTFHMTADALYALPFEPPTLKSLGFFPDEANAVWRYEQREGRDVNIEIHRPAWGEKDYDFLFFTPLSDEYRIVVTYHGDEKKFVVGADDNDLGGADFEFFIETHAHVDGWCSNKSITVEEYFANAFNDPAIADIYLHSVELVTQYIRDTFGMTFEELYTLPTGE